MKKLLLASIALTRRAGLALLGAAALGLRWLRGAAWQKLLGAGVLAALLLAALPTALLLFLVLLALKAVAVAFLAPAPLELDYRVVEEDAQ